MAAASINFIDHKYVTSFKKEALNIFQSDASKKYIQEAISQQDLGKLTRIFNDMGSEITDKKAFELYFGQANSNPSVYLHNTLMKIEKFFLNPEKDGLSIQFIEAIGEDNYKKLECEALTQGLNIASAFMQAVIADYSMSLSNLPLSDKGKQDHEQALCLQSELNQFNQQVIYSKQGSHYLVKDLVHPWTKSTRQRAKCFCPDRPASGTLR